MTTLILIVIAGGGGYVAGRVRHRRLLETARMVVDWQAQRLDAALRPRPRKRHIPAGTR